MNEHSNLSSLKGLNMLFISPLCIFAGSLANYLTSAKFLLYLGHSLSTWVSDDLQ